MKTIRNLFLVLVVGCMVGCAAPQCKLFISVAMNEAVQKCNLIESTLTDEQKEKKHGGQTVDQWCQTAENVFPYLEDYVHNQCEKIDE